MEASPGLVAGSHNRNDLVVIRQEGDGPKPLSYVDSRICQICGDNVGLNLKREKFVACDECGFPVCRPCYEYERKDSTQACPQCRTRYKRHKGSPRVEGDDEEEKTDDLDNEFNHDVDLDNRDEQQVVDEMLHSQMAYGRDTDVTLSAMQPPYPLLTDGHRHTVSITSDSDAMSPDRQAIFPVTGRRLTHAISYSDIGTPVRALDSAKDAGSDGYGNIVWKERVESWKSRQGMQMTMREGDQLQASGEGGYDGSGLDCSDLPM